MSVVAPEASPAMGVTHILLPYADRDQYLNGTLTYIEQARAGGGTLVIIATPARREQLAPHIPGDAAVFVDPGRALRNPGRLIPALQNWVGRLCRDRPVHAINESVWPARTTAYTNELRYQEWLLNRAFADAPAWSLMCPFDTARHDASAVAAITRCHPLLWDGAETVASTGFLTGDYPFHALAEPIGPVERVPYDLSGLAGLRQTVTRFATACGLGAERVCDLRLAVAELAANSVRHGGGRGTALLWRTPESVVCETSDAGVITDPLVGLIKPTAAQIGGRGLWFVHSLSDLVEVRSAPGTGTRVRVSVDLPPRD